MKTLRFVSIILILVHLFLASSNSAIGSTPSKKILKQHLEINNNEYIDIYKGDPQSNGKYWTYIIYKKADGSEIEYYKTKGYNEDYNTTLLYNLGTTYLLMRDNNKVAIKLLLASTKLKNPLPQTYGNLGKAYLREGKYNKAVEISRQGLKIKPKNSILWTNLIAALRKSNRIKEAIEEAKKAKYYTVDSQAGYSFLFHEIAIVLADDKEFDLAADFFYDNGGLMLPQTFVYIYINDPKSKDKKYAKQFKKSVTTLYGNEPIRHHFYASLLAAQGKKAQALKQLQIAKQKGYKPTKHMIEEDPYLNSIFQRKELTFLYKN
ncbi:MAG: hypothetical protein HQ564_07030 [Candidatus Saganbacteria bacterium]|nr:hypothetical protein [Candidatus Saganbacteria bacterium]